MEGNSHTAFVLSAQKIFKTNIIETLICVGLQYLCCQQLPKEHTSLQITSMNSALISPLHDHFWQLTINTSTQKAISEQIWHSSDKSVIAVLSFCLTCPSKECILPAKDLCKHWGILISCVSETHHLLAATLSFVTHPLGNNSPYIVNNSTSSILAESYFCAPCER